MDSVIESKRIKIIIFFCLCIASLQAASIGDIFKSGLQTTGDLDTSGDVFLIGEADGTIEAPSGSGVIHCGENTSDPACTKSGQRVNGAPGNWPDVDNAEDKSTAWNLTTLDLQPGTYRDVNIGYQHKLILHNGTYYMRKLTFGSNAELNTSSVTNTVQLLIRDSTDFSNVSVNCDSNDNPLPPHHLAFYSGGDVTITDGGCISGFVYLLDGKLTFNSNVVAAGAFSADTMSLLDQSRITNRVDDLPLVDFGPICQSNMCLVKEKGGKWHMIGIPADIDGKTVSEVFGDDFDDNNFTGSSSDTWRIYERTYSDTDNTSSYSMVPTNGTLHQGQGYWLGNQNDIVWDLDGLANVTWDTNCPNVNNSKVTECLTIRLKSASDNSTPPQGGPYRYFLSGYMGLKTARWMDFRFKINGGSAITPTEAHDNGLIDNQIWIYNEGSNAYDTCVDDDAGCVVDPREGFWIELNSTTTNQTIDLIIPNGGA